MPNKPSGITWIDDFYRLVDRLLREQGSPGLEPLEEDDVKPVMSDHWSDAPLDWIKPRDIAPMPRCPVCKSATSVLGDHRPPPMYHPAHPYGPCQVSLDGQPCGCQHGLRS